MAKLTRVETKAHDEAMALINLDRRLTPAEVDFAHCNYHPAAEHNVTKNAAFFTPAGPAYVVAMNTYVDDRVVDLGAGIGALAWAVWQRSEGKADLTCIEWNPEYCRVGEKLLPEARWINRDMFDQSLWEELGSFDYGISNPPFGRVAGDKTTRSWLKMTNPTHFCVAELILRHCRMGGTLIFPSNDLPYREGTFHEFKETREYTRPLQRFLKAYPDAILGSLSWRLDEYKGDWRGVAPNVQACKLEWDSDCPVWEGEVAKAVEAVVAIEQPSLFTMPVSERLS